VFFYSLYNIPNMINKIISQKTNNRKLVARLTIAKNLLENDFSTKLDIKTLAKEASLSKFHFCRSFKSVFGMTPHQYALNKRLERSVELINEGKLMVTDIAYQVGFADVYSFSKCFKKRYNACPTKFPATSIPVFNSHKFFEERNFF